MGWCSDNEGYLYNANTSFKIVFSFLTGIFFMGPINNIFILARFSTMRSGWVDAFSVYNSDIGLMIFFMCP